MQRHRCYYRTTDGLADYEFQFEERLFGEWRVYILDQPNYGFRASDDHTTHRIYDGSKYYICWTDKIRSLSDAKKVASKWADATQLYIKYGIKF